MRRFTFEGLFVLPFAHAFYVVGGLILLLLSILFARRYPSPFYRFYTVAFACAFMVVVTETTNPQLTKAPHWGAVVGIGLLISGACLFRSAEHLLGTVGRWPIVPVSAALAVLAVGLAIAGVEGRMIVMVGGLSFTAALVRLGLIFWRLRPASSPEGFRWLGVSLIMLGLWPLLVPYPVFAGTPIAAIGFLGSGFWQVLAGVGMLTYLLDEAWSRYQAEQMRHDRLKSEFISIVSHELRTPLTSIMGYTEFLEDELEGPLTPGQQEYLTQIQANSRRLQRLVDDLLDFSMLDGQELKLQLNVDDLRDRVRMVVDAMAPQARKAGVELLSDLTARPVSLQMDSDRIEQVVTNLVGNAIKFTPTGGRVSVTMHLDPQAVRVEVADTGIGIPEEKLPHIFDRFYQVDATLTRSREGAGLGLAIAQTIAEAHGGTLTAESRLGQGSVFRLTLPYEALKVDVVPSI